MLLLCSPQPWLRLLGVAVSRKGSRYQPPAGASGTAVGAAAMPSAVAPQVKVPAAKAPSVALAPVATAVRPTLASSAPVIFFDSSLPARPTESRCSGVNAVPGADISSY